ncbi:hypothetical protein [Streptomyces sp. NPDC090025]|uniref:hypothetical protein n=1 Tax=Streptomyces sp. NPDC090025 TaxID=3365922 RepID=UPI003833A7A9
MESSPEDPGSQDDSPLAPYAPPWSGREFSALDLALRSASTDADRKHIIETAGTTLEELAEVFGFAVAPLMSRDDTADDG